MSAPKRGNMSKSDQRQGDIRRDQIAEVISLYPGIVMADIAAKLDMPKSTVYPHVAILIATGRAKPVAFAGKVGTRGSSIGYWPPEEGDERIEIPGRFDLPTRIMVAATDGAVLPDPDPILAAFFGK